MLSSIACCRMRSAIESRVEPCRNDVSTEVDVRGPVVSIWGRLQASSVSTSAATAATGARREKRIIDISGRRDS
jgi:hypothetical protein